MVKKDLYLIIEEDNETGSGTLTGQTTNLDTARNTARKQNANQNGGKTIKKDDDEYRGKDSSHIVTDKDTFNDTFKSI